MDFDQRKKGFRRRVYQYVLRLIRFLSGLPNDSVLNELRSQLIKSGTSVGANYYEAIAGSSKRDFMNFFSHSLKSANESKFWLAVIRDSGLIEPEKRPECEALLTETKEIANILASSLLTMKGRKAKQP